MSSLNESFLEGGGSILGFDISILKTRWFWKTFWKSPNSTILWNIYFHGVSGIFSIVYRHHNIGGKSSQTVRLFVLLIFQSQSSKPWFANTFSIKNPSSTIRYTSCSIYIFLAYPSAHNIVSNATTLNGRPHYPLFIFPLQARSTSVCLNVLASMKRKAAFAVFLRKPLILRGNIPDIASRCIKQKFDQVCASLLV